MNGVTADAGGRVVTSRAQQSVTSHAHNEQSATRLLATLLKLTPSANKSVRTEMSTTTIITPSSSPTKVKRTRSIMLTPTKHSKAEQSEPEREAKPRPTHQELLSWTTTNDAIAPCHIKDVYSLQERAVAGGVDPPQPAKQPGKLT